MTKVDHYGAQYGNFHSDVLVAVRHEVFGDDYGQNGWQTADELSHLVDDLALGSGSAVLDVGCGSGGPSLRVVESTGCSLVGIDVNEDAIAAARATADGRGLADQTAFHQGNAGEALPFESEQFDGIICIDAINHLPDRARVLADFARVLKPGARLLYTDPVVVTGWLTNDEIGARSSIGFFLFCPPGVNEDLLDAAGLDIVSVEDRTADVATVAERWRAARDRHAEELCQIEGEETFHGQQRFFGVAARLAAQRRLSRRVFLAQKPADE